MTEIPYLTDPYDPRLADFRDLAKADRRPDRPGGPGVIIAEGTVVVQRLLESGQRIRSVIGLPHRLAKLSEKYGELPVAAYAVTESLLGEVVGFPFHRGILAIADRPEPKLAEEVLCQARSVVVLEKIGDPENLGAIFRNAAALGADAVVLGPGCADPFYRRCVRVSMGHVVRIPFVITDDLPKCLKNLGEEEFRLLALTPAKDSVSIRSLDVSSFEKVALILGSEGEGLTEETLRMADVRVRIPMANEVDSVNVATAAALAFYQLNLMGT